MAKSEQKNSNASLESIVSTAIQLPGVKVSRDIFLHEQFPDISKEMLEKIVEVGPVEAGCDRDVLKSMAQRLINNRTLKSTGASFIAGIPGGLAMAASIPLDMLQFYGVALRLAQELAYLYGEPDMWQMDVLDKDRVTNQMILYCGVMLGSAGASQAVRLMSSALAKQIAKKLPQKALTKTFYYPVVKSICTAFGLKMTKSIFAKGISKAVPVIGGVVSGGITFATMRPMGIRLADTLDNAHFDYTEADITADINDVIEISDEGEETVVDQPTNSMSIADEIVRAKGLLDTGIITEEEFNDIKAKLIAKM